MYKIQDFRKEYNLDLSSNPSGIYLVKIKTSKANSILKYIKQ